MHAKLYGLVKECVDFHEIKKNVRLQALQSEHLGYREIEKQNLKSGKHAS
jgi:hypothetical protein